MLYHLEAVAEDVVNVDPFWVAGVRHTVVAHEHDVHNIRKVARFQRIMEVFGELVDFSQNLVDEV